MEPRVETLVQKKDYLVLAMEMDNGCPLWRVILIGGAREFQEWRGNHWLVKAQLRD